MFKLGNVLNPEELSNSIKERDIEMSKDFVNIAKILLDFP